MISSLCSRQTKSIHTPFASAPPEPRGPRWPRSLTTPAQATADLNGIDTLSVDNAYKVLGSAIYVAGLTSYSAHDKIRRFLMDFPHCCGQTFADIEAADASICMKMAELAEEGWGVQHDEDGLPLDWIMNDVLLRCLSTQDRERPTAHLPIAP